MRLFDQPSPAAMLEDLLERERGAAMAGRIDLLDRFGAEKPGLAAALQRQPPDRADLVRLRRLAERNARLLAAVRDGVAAAQEKLRALAAGGGTLTTYDAAGRSTEVGSRGSAVRRSA